MPETGCSASKSSLPACHEARKIPIVDKKGRPLVISDPPDMNIQYNT